jgi:hypothetical protein
MRHASDAEYRCSCRATKLADDVSAAATWAGVCARSVMDLAASRGKASIALDIPPMTRDASRFEVALGEAGISNLVLDVTVVVT